MPNVSAGSTATVTLSVAASIQLDVDPNEVVAIDVVRSGVQIFGTVCRSSDTVGPFQINDVVRITAVSGQATYTVVQSAPSGLSVASIGSYPFASLPPAGNFPAGTQAFASDLGTWLFSTGVGGYWKTPGPVLLYRNHAQGAQVTGTTSNTLQHELTVPGGLMGINGWLELRGRYSCNSSVGNKGFYVEANTTKVAEALPINHQSQGFTVRIENRGTENSQLGNGQNAQVWNTASDAYNNATIDTSVDWTVSLYLRLANGADNIRMESLEYWLNN